MISTPTTRSSSSFSSLSALLVLTLLLAGCGDKKDDTTKDTNGSTPGKQASQNDGKPDLGGQNPSGNGDGNQPPNDQTPPNDQKPPDGQTPPPTPPPVVQELPPLQFLPELPTTAVAWVNGKEVPAAQLLELVLSQNFSQGVTALLMSKISEMELKKEKIELAQEAVDAEIKVMLERSAPGTTIKEARKSNKISFKHIEQMARSQRAWKELYWKAQNIPPDQRANETNQMLMQFFMRQKMQAYQQRVRGQNPGPIPGLAAEVTDTGTGETQYISASEALDFLIGLSKHGALVQALDQIVDNTIVDQALAKAGVEVKDSEIAAWAAEMRAKHPPPFTWEQICRIKGKTTEMEKQRWARIQAYQRITKKEATDDDIAAFLEENKGYFLGETKKFSHILISTTDPETQLPIEEKQEEAEAKIKLVHNKVIEGLDFHWLAETYSDDPVTARGKGRIGQAFKKWGGAWDPTFHQAAWKLEKVGDISEPVKSRFGWHVIKLDEVNEPTRKEPNWDDPRYKEWVVDEYLTKVMETWLDGVKNAAEVKKAAKAEIFGLKDRSYWTEPEKQPKEDPKEDPKKDSKKDSKKPDGK